MPRIEMRILQKRLFLFLNSRRARAAVLHDELDAGSSEHPRSFDGAAEVGTNFRAKPLVGRGLVFVVARSSDSISVPRASVRDRLSLYPD
jgi:hypothetical protein